MSKRSFKVGSLLLANGYPVEAYGYLAESDRDNPDVLLNLGVCCRQLNMFAAAQANLLKSLALNPSGAAFTNLGSLMEDLGEFCQATEYHAAGHAKAPENTHIALNYAFCLLREGRFEEAWPLWEFGRSANDHAYPNLPRLKIIPGGYYPTGAKVLICREGGFGDVFLYMRWFKNLKDLGFSIHFWVWESIIPLLQGHPWIDELLPEKAGIHPFIEEVGGDYKSGGNKVKLRYDYMLPLMSLPSALGLTEDIALPLEPYINIYKPRAVGPKRVGLCWRAEENTVVRKHRSLSDHDAIRIMHHSPQNVEWTSLVPGVGTAKPYGGDDAILPADATWLDTAKVIAGCDLIVSVDTAVAHLSSAMGKPTWILLPMRRDQKWGVPERPHHWYKRTRYFQQTDAIKWDNVVDEVVAALKEQQ